MCPVVNIGGKMERKGKNQGFTLVELIIAVAILSIIIAPAFSAFIMSAGTNNKATSVLRATEVTGDIMEQMNTKRFSKYKDSFSAGGLDLFSDLGFAPGYYESVSVDKTAEGGADSDFLSKLKVKLGSGSVTSQRVISFSDDLDVFVAFVNFPYDNSFYDIVIHFNKNQIGANAKFTWNLEMSAYSVTNGYHFDTKRLCSITGSVID